MSSSTAAPATGRGGHYAERQGYGLIIFASVLLRDHPHEGDDVDPAARHAGQSSEQYANTRWLRDNRREITDLRDHVHGAGGRHAA
jgi:hypothetical protein